MIITIYMYIIMITHYDYDFENKIQKVIYTYIMYETERLVYHIFIKILFTK
jgi:hypothetical protein